MWTKEDYQEHMLGYLDGVQAEIEQMAVRFSLRQQDLNELRADLDIASERLWWLIESSEADWEGFRYALETRCDKLLRALRYAPSAHSLKPSHVAFRTIRPSAYLNSTVIQRGPEIATVQKTLDR